MKYEHLVLNITHLHTTSQQLAGRSLNRIMSLRSWLIGAWIIEFEQGGEERAAYGERLIQTLAAGLKTAGCRGFSIRNLKNFRQVALAYPEISVDAVPLLKDIVTIQQTSAESPFPSLATRARAESAPAWRDEAWARRLFSTLTFSHLLELSRVEEPLKRGFYELQCIKSGWSVRELKRQKGSLLYERIGLSRDPDAALALAEEGRLLETPEAVIRDPYVLEFLGVSAPTSMTESDLEQALLDHLQAFLLELGHDFCFMGRQFRVTMNTNHYFIDLLFYHRGLRCLVAFDLKVEPFRHEQAGQMNFYLNYLADNISREGESPPVGVILCTEKDVAEVHYATAGLPQPVFVSRYLAALPSQERLERWLREERALLQVEE